MAEHLRVLLLEDSRDDAALIERELRKGLPACEIRSVDQGPDFLRALEEFKPGLILSDHSMAGFSGMHALELAKRVAPETPFLFVTGSLDEETAAQCVKAGAWDYVLKDRLTRLIPAVTASLELRATRDALKRSEEQLLQTQKMDALGRLAGGVAHDYNNLTTAILGYTTLVLETLEAGDPRRADLEEVYRAGERAADLSHQLLAFSRKQVIKAQRISLNAVVSDTDRLMTRLIGEHITMNTMLAADLPAVYSDPGQLQQVLVNLVVNARDAMPEGGTLSIETDEALVTVEHLIRHAEANPGPHVRLRVSDTGIGMDQETQDRVFEPFFTTKPRGQGTGLGLATVYGIVRQSGGHITIDSTPRAGTTFSVYLPVAAESDVIEPSEVDREPADLAGTETVLIAEDDPAVRSLARRVLQSYGYKTIEAATGTQAIGAGRRTTALHLLLTDVVMPELGGPELFAAVQEFHPKLRVVYMSGYTEHDHARHGVERLGGAFLPKPF